MNCIIFRTFSNGSNDCHNPMFRKPVLFVFIKYRVQISVREQVILIELFSAFLQVLQAYSGLINYLWTLPSTYLPSH